MDLQLGMDSDMFLQYMPFEMDNLRRSCTLVQVLQLAALYIEYNHLQLEVDYKHIFLCDFELCK